MVKRLPAEDGGVCFNPRVTVVYTKINFDFFEYSDWNSSNNNLTLLTFEHKLRDLRHHRCNFKGSIPFSRVEYLENEMKSDITCIKYISPLSFFLENE